MPPKASRPRRGIPNNGLDDSYEEVVGEVISVSDAVASDGSSVVVTSSKKLPRKRPLRRRPSTRGFVASGRGGYGSRPYREAVPEPFQNLLEEAVHLSSASEEDRPRKRRRIRQPGEAASTKESKSSATDADEDDDLAFEDVLPLNSQQTIYRDTDEGSGSSDAEWEGLDLSAAQDSKDSDSGDLDLTLTSKTHLEKPAAVRRRVINKADKSLRLEIHKMHILCLISCIKRRSLWCNDEAVQRALLPMVNNKILANLRPDQALSQFRQTDLLTTGLGQLIAVWNARFTIVTRGMRRALWAENEENLKNYKLPIDAEGVMEKHDFTSVAKSLKSSRDTGALLFCSLLRAVGLEVRLICSLQPLPFRTTADTLAPTTATPSPIVAKASKSEHSGDEERVDINNLTERGGFGSNAPFAARRRLGHPHAAGYQIPASAPPVRPPVSKPKVKPIRESPFPVFWVEVLDEAHQKWLPVDPLVTRTIGKPGKLEPPASDNENNMAYVLAFEDDGVVRDVTRRYAKAYKSKTRRHRMDSTADGAKWWGKTMRCFARDWQRDLDALEDAELNNVEAREPMPRNIIDFKDHPTYALERHLRQNEVLITRHEVGKVSSGRTGKAMEPVFRRSDVKIARSADRWYRQGRDVKVGEQPVKIMPSRKVADADEGEREEAGTALYTEEQTELYIPPPIVNGRVPRNTYGNLDVYVSSMIPKGGAHIPFDDASKAAKILGVDYADAVTGFKFQGRRGTPIVNGIVAAVDYREAILTVIEGLRDDRARAEEDMRSMAALRMWKKFLISMRIKERVDGYEIEGEEAELSKDSAGNPTEQDEDMQSEEYDEGDFGGGGFFPE